MPAIRNQVNATLICELITGGASLRQIAKHIGCSNSAIVTWADSDPDFAEQYARAMQRRAEYYAHEIMEIADDGSNDWMEREGLVVADHEHIQRSKLRVDARKWLMGKLAPKRFGDRMEHEHSGTISHEVLVMQAIGTTIEHAPKPVRAIEYKEATEPSVVGEGMGKSGKA